MTIRKKLCGPVAMLSALRLLNVPIKTFRLALCQFRKPTGCFGTALLVHRTRIGQKTFTAIAVKEGIFLSMYIYSNILALHLEITS